MIPVNIQSIVREINRELSPQFEEQLRHHLDKKTKSWLIDQIVRLTPDTHSMGTWNDPDGLSNDERADNRILQIEFGEVASELARIC